MIQTLGMVSGIMMPLFNLPLMLRVIRRRSSQDISLVWVIGVWFCVMGLLPSSLQSLDPILFAFGVVNALLFSGVFFSVLYFHPTLRKRRHDSR